MSVRERRQLAMLSTLRSAHGPMTAKELGDKLDISPRSIRDYVAQLNSGRERPLVLSDQAGYRLDLAQYSSFRRDRAEARPTSDSRQQRLHSLLRELVRAGTVDVYELASDLSVSDATLESDLVRARAYLREHDIILRRNRHLVTVEGSERGRRRLLRQVLLASGDELGAGSAVAGAHSRRQTLRLQRAVEAALGRHGITINSYVLPSVVLHLQVATERIRAGHSIDGSVTAMGTEADVVAAVHEVAKSVREVTGVDLGVGDRALLYGVLLANTDHPQTDELSLRTANPRVVTMVREAVDDVVDHYGVDLSEGSTFNSLILHIDNLVKRAQAGSELASPTGEGLRRSHPLIHELALYVAQRVERDFGIDIGPGEVDFIALHLGVRFQAYLEAGRRVTITLVTPRHRDNATELASALSQRLRDDAVVEEVITDLTTDLSSVTSDLLVSTVDVVGDLAVPTVRISPFLTRVDVEALQSACKGERGRRGREFVRSNLMAMLDESLFVHRPTFDSAGEAISLGAQLMHSQGLVEDGFLDDVLDRERRSPTAFDAEFAIPHSMYLDALRTGIAVLTAVEPIPWNGSPVRLVVLFAISPMGRPLFRDLLDALVEVLGDAHSVRELVEAGTTFESFRSTLSRLLS